MENVVVEMLYDPPLPPTNFTETLGAASWCFQLHQVAHRRAHLALDGHKSACVFDAPDAESVRLALRQLDCGDALVWSATVHDPPELEAAHDALRDGAEIIVVERSFAQPAPFEELQERETRGAWCLAQHAVRFLRTYAARDERRMLCLYAAPDAESVRLAQAKADMPFERAWTARLLLDADEDPRAR